MRGKKPPDRYAEPDRCGAVSPYCSYQGRTSFTPSSVLEFRGEKTCVRRRGTNAARSRTSAPIRERQGVWGHGTLLRPHVAQASSVFVFLAPRARWAPGFGRDRLSTRAVTLPASPLAPMAPSCFALPHTRYGTASCSLPLAGQLSEDGRFCVSGNCSERTGILTPSSQGFTVTGEPYTRCIVAWPSRRRKPIARTFRLLSCFDVPATARADPPHLGGRKRPRSPGRLPATNRWLHGRRCTGSTKRGSMRD